MSDHRPVAWLGVLIGVALCAAPAAAIELTPQVRARLFAPTESVRLDRKVVTIPLDGTDHRGFYKCPYVRVYVNGRGPFTFLFDTGASYTLVSSRVAAAARTPVVFDRSGHRDVVQVAKLKVGGVELDDVWAIADDSWGVDGILGFAAFGASNILFDLTRRELQVSATPIPMPGSFELPYLGPVNSPTIPVMFGDKTVQTLIDTGDDAYGLEMRGDELAGVAFAHPPVAATSVLNGANVQQTAVTTLAAPVGIGPLRATSAVIAVNDGLPIGDLGYDVLRQFRFQFEPARKVVVFQPQVPGAALQIGGAPSLGFTLAFDGTGKVRSVAPGSGAERAGIAPDDRIISLDGVAGGRWTPRTWDGRMARSKPAVVRWSHAGVEHAASLPVETLR